MVQDTPYITLVNKILFAGPNDGLHTHNHFTRKRARHVISGSIGDAFCEVSSLGETRANPKSG